MKTHKHIRCKQKLFFFWNCPWLSSNSSPFLFRSAAKSLSLWALKKSGGGPWTPSRIQGVGVVANPSLSYPPIASTPYAQAPRVLTADTCHKRGDLATGGGGSSRKILAGLHRIITPRLRCEGDNLSTDPEKAEEELQAKVNQELADYERLEFKPFHATARMQEMPESEEVSLSPQFSRQQMCLGVI